MYPFQNPFAQQFAASAAPTNRGRCMRCERAGHPRQQCQDPRHAGAQPGPCPHDRDQPAFGVASWPGSPAALPSPFSPTASLAAFGLQPQLALTSPAAPGLAGPVVSPASLSAMFPGASPALLQTAAQAITAQQQQQADRQLQEQLVAFGLAPPPSTLPTNLPPAAHPFVVAAAGPTAPLPTRMIEDAPVLMQPLTSQSQAYQRVYNAQLTHQNLVTAIAARAPNQPQPRLSHLDFDFSLPATLGVGMTMQVVVAVFESAVNPLAAAEPNNIAALRTAAPNSALRSPNNTTRYTLAFPAPRNLATDPVWIMIAVRVVGGTNANHVDVGSCDVSVGALV